MYKITSNYFAKESFRNSPHLGVDFKMETGTPLRSVREGVIEKVIDYGNVNAGKCIKVKFDNGDTAIYGHLSEFTVKEGQHVNVGDLIGYSGNSGFSTGSHLHFGLKNGDGNFIDPSPYINDIQNMNNPRYFAQVSNVKVSFFDYFQEHMIGVTDSLMQMKINLIYSLSNDILFIQIFEQVFQFFSTHASFLNHIITGIL